MKKNLTLIAGCVLIYSISFLIYSCSKKQDIVINSSGTVLSEVPDNLLQAAKEWHADQIKVSLVQAGALSINAVKPKGKLMPNWKAARLEKIAGGSESLVVVEGPVIKLSPSTTAGVVRKFVFSTNGNSITDGKIIEIFGPAEYIANHRDNILENYNDNRVDGFSGAVIIYDVNYKFITSKVYKNGIKTTGTAGISQSKKPPLSLNGNKLGVNSLAGASEDQYNGEDCNYVYYDLYQGIYQIAHTYMYCYGPECHGGDTDNEIGGNSNWGDPNAGNSGGGGGSSAVASTTSTDITDPCLQQAYNTVTANNSVNNTINDLISSVFNVNDKVNLIFNQSTSLAANRMGNTTSPGIAGHDVNGNTVYNVNVSLNANVLPGAAQELAAVTIIHESLHGYFEYNGVANGDALAQHILIGTKYVDLIRDFLQARYTISDDEANALVLGELADIQKSSSSSFDALAAHYNLTSTYIGNTMYNYVHAQAGHNCE